MFCPTKLSTEAQKKLSRLQKTMTLSHKTDALLMNILETATLTKTVDFDSLLFLIETHPQAFPEKMRKAFEAFVASLLNDFSSPHQPKEHKTQSVNLLGGLLYMSGLVYSGIEGLDGIATILMGWRNELPFGLSYQSILNKGLWVFGLSMIYQSNIVSPLILRFITPALNKEISWLKIYDAQYLAMIEINRQLARRLPGHLNELESIEKLFQSLQRHNEYLKAAYTEKIVRFQGHALLPYYLYALHILTTITTIVAIICPVFTLLTLLYNLAHVLIFSQALGLGLAFFSFIECGKSLYEYLCDGYQTTERQLYQGLGLDKAGIDAFMAQQEAASFNETQTLIDALKDTSRSAHQLRFFSRPRSQSVPDLTTALERQTQPSSQFSSHF
jgi:hypothetical protein